MNMHHAALAANDGGAPAPGLFREEWIAGIQQLFGVGHPQAFHAISLLGDTWGLLLAVGIAYWVYGRRTAYTTAAALAVALPLWLGLATLFSVPRPSGSGIVIYDDLQAGAFPSGHVFHVIVAWGTMARLSGVPVWTVAVIALATALGRLYLGAHHLADVIASLLIAPAFVLAFLRVTQNGERIPARPPRSTALRLVLIALALGGTALVTQLAPGRLRRWEVIGLGIGALLVLALSGRSAEDRTIRARAPARAVLTGFAGILALALVSRIFGPAAPALGGIMAASAVLWVFLGVRLARPEPPPPGE